MTLPEPGRLRSPDEDAELTRLLTEWDRVTTRLEELGVRMPRRPGAVTMAEWDAETEPPPGKYEEELFADSAEDYRRHC